MDVSLIHGSAGEANDGASLWPRVSAWPLQVLIGFVVQVHAVHRHPERFLLLSPHSSECGLNLAMYLSGALNS
jgi:hypothetical protein